MIQGLSVAYLAGLPKDSTGWVAINENTKNKIGIGDKDTDKPVILIFLKMQDARHYARLFREYGAIDKMVDIEQVTLLDCLSEIEEKGQMYAAIIGPNEAMKFFKDHKDSLWEYFEFL